MDYLELPACPALAPWVRRLWWLRAPAPDGPAPVEKVLPDGCVELIVRGGRAFRQTGLEGPAPAGDGVVELAGQLRGHLGLQQVEAVDMIGVRFQPAGAWPFLRQPLGELTDRVVPLADVATDLARDLSDAAQADDPLERLAAVEAVLLARRPERAGRDLLVETAAARLSAAAGDLSVGSLARDLGVSGRHLSRRFAERVGVGPKTLARTLRFQAVLAARKRQTTISWARLAARWGYTDQAHLIRDVRHFSGERPGELMDGDRGLTHLLLSDDLSVFDKPGA